MIKRIFLVSFIFLVAVFSFFFTKNRPFLSSPSNIVTEVKRKSSANVITKLSFKDELYYLANRYSAEQKTFVCNWINKVNEQVKPFVRKVCHLDNKESFRSFYSLIKERVGILENSTVFEIGLFDLKALPEELQTEKKILREKLLKLFNNKYEKSFIIKGFAYGDCLQKRPHSYAFNYVKSLKNPYYKAIIYQALKDCYFIRFKDKPDWSLFKVDVAEIDNFEFNLLKRLEKRLKRQLNDQEKQIINKERIREKLVILDEYSQIAYLQKSYETVKDLTKKYLEIFPKSEDFYFLNQKVMVSVRQAKASLKLNEVSVALSVLAMLPELQSHMRLLKKTYYPDVSLASLLLKKGEKTAVISYLDNLAKKGLILNDTKDQLMLGLKNEKSFNLELALYKIRYKGKENSGYYKAETEQIRNLAE